MNQKALWHMSVRKISEYVFMTLIILSNSIYCYSNNVFFNYGLKVIISFFCLASFVFVKKTVDLSIKSRRRFVFILATYMLFVCLYLANGVDKDKMMSFILRFIVFIPLMIVYFLQMEQVGKFFEIISNIMLVLSIISLFFYLFGTCLHILTPTGAMYSTWGNTYRNHYYHMYFEVPATAFGFGVYRNVGIFAEAPAYCFFLSVGLLGEIYLGGKNKYKLAVLLLTIATTVSMTGFLIILCVIFEAFLRKSRQGRFRGKLTFLLFAISVVIIFYAIYQLSLDPSKAYSVYLRQQDYINAFLALRVSPLWGHGYQVLSTEYNAGFSNSISLVILNGGLILGGIFGIPMITILIRSYRCHSDMFYFMGGILLLFAISIVGYTYFMLSFLAYGYALLIKKNAIIE